MADCLREMEAVMRIMGAIRSDPDKGDALAALTYIEVLAAELRRDLTGHRQPHVEPVHHDSETVADEHGPVRITAEELAEVRATPIKVDAAK